MASGYWSTVDYFRVLKNFRQRNWQDIPQNPDDIDAVIITHSHIDHIGYLPRIVKQGYNGPIYCTEVTEDLMQIMLMDSAKIQEEEAAFARKKGYSKHANPQPLYGTEHVKRLFKNIRSMPGGKWIPVQDRVKIKFHNAGHILGSSIIEIQLEGDSETKTVVSLGI